MGGLFGTYDISVYVRLGVRTCLILIDKMHYHCNILCYQIISVQINDKCDDSNQIITIMSL